MNTSLITNSFHDHSIFKYFWHDSVLKFLQGEIELDFVPHEYMSYYQKKFSCMLTNLNTSNEIASMNARITLTLTSFSKNFDVDMAISEIDCSNKTCAILVSVDAFDEDNNKVYTTQFNLGSKEPEKVTTNSMILNLLK